MTAKTRIDTAVGVPLHQIGEVADLIGLSLRTIRHYEEVGVVVPSAHSPGGFRLYTDRDIGRLRRVMGMKPIGFSLEEIRDVLDMLEAADGDNPEPAVIRRLEAVAALAVERRDKFRARLVLAEAFTDELVTRFGEDREPG